MSCENTSNKVVALARKVGIPHLSGKKAFYAGLLVAASQASVVLATLGLLAAIKAKASGNKSPGQGAPGGNDRKPVAIVTPQDIPPLPSRRAITPAAPQTPRRMASRRDTRFWLLGLWFVPMISVLLVLPVDCRARKPAVSCHLSPASVAINAAEETRGY